MWVKDRLIYSSLNKVKDVSGRFELVRKFPNDIKVYVDYAHTQILCSKHLSL